MVKDAATIGVERGLRFSSRRLIEICVHGHPSAMATERFGRKLCDPRHCCLQRDTDFLSVVCAHHLPESHSRGCLFTRQISVGYCHAQGAVLRAGGRLAVNKMSKIPSRRAYVPAEGKDTKVITRVFEQCFFTAIKYT